MNRAVPYLFCLALLVAFIGGAKTAIDAKDVERNARVKEINANIDKGINLANRIAEDRRYQSLARDFVDPPPEWRCKNYSGGSCVHATAVTLLRWQGLQKKADEYRAKYRGGENTGGPSHTRKFDAEGLKYVTTQDGDVKLLEWACATRRGCGITYPAGHSIALVGHENGEAVLLDNNHVDRYDRVPWDTFVAKWKRLGGQAFAFCYTPPPPTPRH